MALLHVLAEEEMLGEEPGFPQRKEWIPLQTKVLEYSCLAR